MNKNSFVTFEEYISEKGINITKRFDHNGQDIRCLTEDDVKESIKALSEFHREAMGFNGYFKKKLDNDTGKLVEGCKVSIKRLKKDLKRINNDKPQNPLEKEVLNKGPEFLERAEKCISAVNNSGYLDIILRSMRRTEICLGDVNPYNIYNRKGITVDNINDCVYNLIEIDCVSMLYGMKKRGKSYNWVYLVHRFCMDEDLDSNSLDFILALISYPHEFMKCCDRYREKKKEWNPRKYRDKLNKAIIQDSISLI